MRVFAEEILFVVSLYPAGDVRDARSTPRTFEPLSKLEVAGQSSDFHGSARANRYDCFACDGARVFSLHTVDFNDLEKHTSSGALCLRDDIRMKIEEKLAEAAECRQTAQNLIKRMACK